MQDRAAAARRARLRRTFGRFATTRG